MKIYRNKKTIEIINLEIDLMNEDAEEIFKKYADEEKFKINDEYIENNILYVELIKINIEEL